MLKFLAIITCLVGMSLCLLVYWGTRLGVDPPTNSVEPLGGLFFLGVFSVLLYWGFSNRQLLTQALPEKPKPPAWFNLVFAVIAVGICVNTQCADTRSFGLVDGQYHHWTAVGHSIISEEEYHRIHLNAMSLKSLVFASWYLAGIVALLSPTSYCLESKTANQPSS